MTENTQHLSIHAPSWAPHQEPRPEPASDLWCDYCPERLPDDFEADPVSGDKICDHCMERFREAL